MHISEICGIPMKEEKRLFEQNFGKYESTPRNGEEFRELTRKKQMIPEEECIEILGSIIYAFEEKKH